MMLRVGIVAAMVAAQFCGLLSAALHAQEPGPADASAPHVTIASKIFTESVVLAQLATLAARDTGADVTLRAELGGTRVVWEALRLGAIDVYPEYTGTLVEEVFAGESLSDLAALRRRLARDGVSMTDPLGFNNTYALGIKPALADNLGIAKISDLRKHPDLRFGMSNEFLDRGDGWPALRERYRLPQRDVRGMQHELAYQALDGGSIDVIDLYSTDAEIAYYGLWVFEDDLGHFPRYDAVYLYRSDLAQRAPRVVAALNQLAGMIDADAMTEMNERAKIERVPENRVAADFLSARLGIDVEVAARSAWRRLWRNAREHTFLVAVSLAAAIVVGVPLGIVAARRPRFGQAILTFVGTVQTIPGLALLMFLFVPMVALGFPIGAPPTIVAMFLYSLLPIVRNTQTGLVQIAVPVRESAEALGLPAGARLRLVELPLAAPTILAGVKTAAVINVGLATLGALAGAGGFGQPILTGIRLNDYRLILLQGALPAAVMAWGVLALFEGLERLVVPRGLRLKRE